MCAEDFLLYIISVLESCIQLWSPQHRIHRDLLEQGQKPWRAGAPLYGERLRLEWFSLEGRRLWGHLTAGSWNKKLLSRACCNTRKERF